MLCGAKRKDHCLELYDTGLDVVSCLLCKNSVGSVRITVCQDLHLLSVELFPSLFHCREIIQPSSGTSYLPRLDFMTVLLTYSSCLSKSIWMAALVSRLLTPSQFVDDTFYPSVQETDKDIKCNKDPEVSPTVLYL